MSDLAPRHRFDIMRAFTAQVERSETAPFDATALISFSVEILARRYGSFAAAEMLRQFAAEYEGKETR